VAATIVHTDRAPAAIGPYSQALVSEDWVFCSGQIPVVPGTGELVDGGITEQTERVLTNLFAVLEAAGASPERVLKTTVFLADMRDFAAMNDVYARRFGAHRPARSTIQAAGLPRGSRVEIECIARRKDV
jgi:2-iminobutanoate/2-iminopropanoate deaminase